MDPLTILAAFAPLGVEAVKGLMNRFLGSADLKPATVDEWLKMRGFDLQMFKAMNEAGGANPSYLWVEAVVRLQRPLVACVALGVWAWSYTGGAPSGAVDNFAGAVGFYLFGDRTLFYINKGKK